MELLIERKQKGAKTLAGADRPCTPICSPYARSLSTSCLHKDCETPEAAQAILEGSRYLEIDGQPLRLEYSLSPPSASSAGSGGGGGGASALADWLCDRCGTVNFQRLGGSTMPPPQLLSHTTTTHPITSTAAAALVMAAGPA